MIYDIEGNTLQSVYDSSGADVETAYDIDGNVVYTQSPPEPDYTSYTFTSVWGSKGLNNTQGFSIYDSKVFWIRKSGDSSVPADCYVWNLPSGTQAFQAQPITIYSGHGNSLDIIGSKAYAGTAYSPARAYENDVSADLQTFTLSKTFNLSADASYGHDVCVDENDPTIMWSLAHTGAIGTHNPFLLSKWDITDLTDNGDGTYSPRLISSVNTPNPSNSEYFQGMTMHDGMIWFASGYPGNQAYVYAINPTTGAVLYQINCNTTDEPEGVDWVEDSDAVGGYAMYVGFQQMFLRKYTFAAR